MRTLQLSALLIAFVSFGTSCKKDDDSLKLVPGGVIGLWAGLDTTITLTGKQPFTISSDNASISNGIIQGDQLHITTGVPGVATLRVTDGDKRAGVIKVISGTLEMEWRRRETVLPSTASIVVETGDDVLSTELRTTLAAAAEAQVTGRYSIMFEAGGKFAERTRPGDIIEGTYTFQSRILTLTLPNKVRTYKINPFNISRIYLEEDLTTYYQGLYPGKNVTKVTVTTEMVKINYL